MEVSVYSTFILVMVSNFTKMFVTVGGSRLGQNSCSASLHLLKGKSTLPKKISHKGFLHGDATWRVVNTLIYDYRWDILIRQGCHIV
jgi:hypothetical protein